MILAVDQGTTNTKAILMRRDGSIGALASRPVGISFPRPAWVEQDPAALLESSLAVIRECISQAEGAAIAAIGITNQRESAILWERSSGKALGPCIVWQCRRTAGFCDALRERGAASVIAERSGLAIDPLFSGSKIAWLLDQVDPDRARARNGEFCAGTVDSWLLWNLTGGKIHATDTSNASRTQLLNIRTGQWDPDLLRIFNIPLQCLPDVRPSSAMFGTTLAPLPAGIPIASLIGDSHAALFGHAEFTPGGVKATYGTGSSLMTLTAEPVASRHGISTAVAWRLGDTISHALEGNVTNTGGTVQWLGEFLGLANPSESIAALASHVEDTAGVYLVPAFAGLGAPYWDAGAKGLMVGMTRGTTSAHAARAAIESIAYQVGDVLNAMQADAGRPMPRLLADGGACKNDSLMQFQADILGREVERNTSADLSACGAAWLAGLAVNYWESLDELKRLPRQTQVFRPAMAESKRDNLLAGWQDAVSRARSKNG